jgi:hypothetical protein
MAQQSDLVSCAMCPLRRLMQETGCADTLSHLFAIRSGPKRFDWSAEESEWIYARDGSRLLDLLQTELTEKLEVEVALKS